MDNIDNYLRAIFPHKVLKGSVGSKGLFDLFALQSFFSKLNIEENVNIATFCYKNNIKIENLVRLSDVENLGYKINIPENKKHFFLPIKEPSTFLKNPKVDYLFNIRDTTLPYNLSYYGKLKNFKLNSEFLQQLEKNFTKNSGFSINSDATVDKIKIDFQNKTIRYPFGKDIAKTAQNLVSASILFSICQNNESIYNRIQADEKFKKTVYLDLLFCSNAVLSTLGIDKEYFNANFQKDYIWAKNHESLKKKVVSLSKFISKTSQNLDINKSLLEFDAKMKIDSQENYINKVINSKNNYSNRLSDNEIQELREQTNNEIISSLEVLESVLNSLNIEYKHNRDKIYIYNLKEHNKRKKAPDAVFSFVNNVWLYKNFLNYNEKGTVIQFVQNQTSCNYKEALGFIINNSSAIDHVKEAFETIKLQSKNSNRTFTTKSSNLDLYKQNIIDNYELTEDEYFSLTNMNERELARFEIELKEKKNKSTNYQIKEDEFPIKNNNYNSEKDKPSSWIISTQDIDTNLRGNSPFEKYLKESREYSIIPNDLKLIKGAYQSQKHNKTFETFGVGFINDSNGADLKKFKKHPEYGDAQSFGKKDITTFNKDLIIQTRNDKERTFMVFESQWDYVAAYQDEDFRKVIDKSITFVLNGAASNGIQKIIDTINNNKLNNTKVILFDQADEASTRVMTNIEMAVSGITDGSYLATANTKGKAVVYRCSYNEEQYNRKMDLNDILKECKQNNMKFNVNKMVNKNNIHNQNKNNKVKTFVLS